MFDFKSAEWSWFETYLSARGFTLDKSLYGAMEVRRQGDAALLACENSAWHCWLFHLQVSLSDFEIEYEKHKIQSDIAALEAAMAAGERYQYSCLHPEERLTDAGWEPLGEGLYRGTTPRTRAIARQGKIAQWVRAGLSRDDAERVLRGESVRWMWEENVMKAVSIALPIVRAAGITDLSEWGEVDRLILCGSYGTHYPPSAEREAMETALDPLPLSAPRTMSVCELVRRVLSSP